MPKLDQALLEEWMDELPGSTRPAVVVDTSEDLHYRLVSAEEKRGE